VTALNSPPSCNTPVIDGKPVLLGSNAPTRLEAGDVADTDPAEFVAVTTTRNVEPT
jgi:hypothetical protein